MLLALLEAIGYWVCMLWYSRSHDADLVEITSAAHFLWEWDRDPGGAGGVD